MSLSSLCVYLRLHCVCTWLVYTWISALATALRCSYGHALCRKLKLLTTCNHKGVNSIVTEFEVPKWRKMSKMCVLKYKWLTSCWFEVMISGDFFVMGMLYMWPGFHPGTTPLSPMGDVNVNFISIAHLKPTRLTRVVYK